MQHLGLYSVGMGDRFGHEAEAQLKAVIKMRKEKGIALTPVWNKSNREHSLIGSSPEDTRKAVDTAVKKMNWNEAYFVDADHITLSTVPRFLEACDFFTIDVADFIGKQSSSRETEYMMKELSPLSGYVLVNGIEEPFLLNTAMLRQGVEKFLEAVNQAAAIYQTIKNHKKDQPFITEISMDETTEPLSPVEMLILLKMLAVKKIPAHTIAPRFPGKFNKGINYRGDLRQFEKEFKKYLFIIDYAIRHFGLSPDLKISLHSGSDKFDLYPVINRLLKKHKKGLHLKTAGTTWLEEIIGLCKAGGEALELVKEMYAQMLMQREALCQPYATVIDINPAHLPAAETVRNWSPEKWVCSLSHETSQPEYNPHMRQLFHVGFKVAATYGERYIRMIEKHHDLIAEGVMTNLYDRHFVPLFS